MLTLSERVVKLERKISEETFFRVSVSSRYDFLRKDYADVGKKVLKEIFSNIDKKLAEKQTPFCKVQLDVDWTSEGEVKTVMLFLDVNLISHEHYVCKNGKRVTATTSRSSDLAELLWKWFPDMTAVIYKSKIETSKSLIMLKTLSMLKSDPDSLFHLLPLDVTQYHIVPLL